MKKDVEYSYVKVGTTLVRKIKVPSVDKVPMTFGVNIESP